jgi:hypothetical protein
MKIEIELRELGLGDMNWIHLALDIGTSGGSCEDGNGPLGELNS